MLVRGRRGWVFIGLMALTSMLLMSCQPDPVIVVTVVTAPPQVKTETRVETKIVTATPAPVAKPKVVRVNLGAFPDVIDPQKSELPWEIAHLEMM